ncbi:hypothetical protein [Pedosphaera parvula]|uniref:Uncharacterized protein n=1 Tax=Pedosphaera parvula (strain Ellin514) TaxID=320771 RepID=B9XCA0_PEDPL|nr:hypothetical protein [Pedosphaera parvula]EEF62568.1 hypothetical protein Cflav_PD5203 [Pedosphaera parvula Ellin514]
MKIFIQHKRTSLYLTRNNEWVKSSNEAVDFPSYDIAVAFASEHDSANLQVILKFADYPYNISLPMQKQPPRTSLQI